MAVKIGNHAAVKIGNLEKGARSKKVVKPRFATDFPGAVVPEGVDDVRLRADEEGVLRTFINTTNVGNKRWSPPLVDEDWHALCQAMFHGVEGPEEAMSCRYKDLHQAVKSKTSEENKRAKVLWASKEAKGIEGLTSVATKRKSRREPE